MSRQLGVFFGFALLSLVMSSTAAESITWREEAVQANGTLLVVERWVSLHGRHERGQDLPIGDQTISFTLPQSQRTIRWTDSFSPEVGMANFLPMVVEARGDTAYVVAKPLNCLAFNKWGRPNPPYVVQRYDGSEWSRIPLADLPADIHYPNIVFSTPEDQGRKARGDLISATEVRKLNSHLVTKQFKEIVRVPVPVPMGGECSEMVRTKHGWVGVGPFRRQPDRPSCERICSIFRMGTDYCPCAALFPDQK